MPPHRFEELFRPCGGDWSIEPAGVDRSNRTCQANSSLPREISIQQHHVRCRRRGGRAGKSHDLGTSDRGTDFQTARDESHEYFDRANAEIDRLLARLFGGWKE